MPIAKFGIFAHVLPLIAHVILLTIHCSCLSFSLLAPIGNQCCQYKKTKPCHI